MQGLWVIYKLKQTNKEIYNIKDTILSSEGEGYKSHGYFLALIPISSEGNTTPEWRY